MEQLEIVYRVVTLIHIILPKDKYYIEHFIFKKLSRPQKRIFRTY